MEQYYIPRIDICMSDAMPFSQHWEIRIPMTIEKLGNLGTALQNSFDQFKAGDLVQVSAFTDKNYVRLLETADFRIVSCFGRKIEAIQTTETIKVPAPRPEMDPSSKQNLHIVSKTAGNQTAFEVQDGLGNVIELFVDEKQAHEFIANYEKITTEPPKPVAEDRSSWFVKKSVTGKWTVRNNKNELIKEFSSRSEAEDFLKPTKEEAA